MSTDFPILPTGLLSAQPVAIVSRPPCRPPSDVGRMCCVLGRGRNLRLGGPELLFVLAEIFQVRADGRFDLVFMSRPGVPEVGCPETRNPVSRDMTARRAHHNRREATS